MRKRKKATVYGLFILYLMLLVWVILFKMAASFSEIASWEPYRSVNLIPFFYDTETSGHLSEVVWNGIAFIPFGIFLRMMDRNPVPTILMGAGFSFLLETLQFTFRIGATDVTDLIMNTGGTAIGVLLYAVAERLLVRKERVDELFLTLAVIGTVFLFLFLIVVVVMNA